MHATNRSEKDNKTGFVVLKTCFSQGLFWHAAVAKHKAFLTPGSQP